MSKSNRSFGIFTDKRNNTDGLAAKRFPPAEAVYHISGEQYSNR